MAAATEMVRLDRHDTGIWVVSLDHPPVNAVTLKVRSALAAVLAEAAASVGPGGARAVVLRAEGRNFSAASAVDTVAEPADAAPDLAGLCRQIEDMPMPVVVALQGAVIGPGAELALAAHARVAEDSARIILPDVGLGLVPSGGSTQRLPRLVGAAEALEILLKARAVPAAEALAIGLIDVLAEDAALPAALAHAARMAAPRPVRDRSDGLADVPGYMAAVTAARQAARGVLPAPPRIVDCVEAALMLPYDNGLALEAVAYADLRDSDESHGLCAMALAERRAAHLPPSVARIRPKAVAMLGLAGGAPHMAALALTALRHGIAVQWADADAARKADTLAWISARAEDDLRAGRSTVVQRDADLARLTSSADLTDLVDCDLVVHAAAGEGLTRLARMRPMVPQLVMGGAEGAIGLGLVPSGRLSELALPAGPAPEHVAVAVQFLRRIGLPPVLTGKMPIQGRRVSAAGRAALVRMLAMGVPRRVLAAALDGYGHPMPDLSDPADPAPMRAMSEAEVLHRWQGAMANEGLRLIHAGVTQRPSDLDLVLGAGFFYPRWRGGPMHQAERRGLLVLRRDLRIWTADDAAVWTPHPLLDRLIAEGRRLQDLNG
ncbi:MAG: enoyl-CoA hydratase-related protein [Paracoccaceae bacterium]